MWYLIGRARRLLVTALPLMLVVSLVTPERCGAHFRPDGLEGVWAAIDRARRRVADVRERIARADGR